MRFSASILAELSVSSAQNQLFLLSIRIFFGSKYPKNIVHNFEKGSTGEVYLTVNIVPESNNIFWDRVLTSILGYDPTNILCML